MSEHHPSLRSYLTVFVILIGLTGLTYNAAYWDSGNHAINVAVAIGIAITKATLVILFFMHVKQSRPLVWLFVASGFIWLALLIIGILHDYLSRGWFGG